jgi:hypothetical protein
MLDYWRGDIRQRVAQALAQKRRSEIPQNLPPLQHGIVTEEIMSNLQKYPPQDQQAWAASLPPLAMQMYRQALAANEARKRGILVDLPSAGRSERPAPPTKQPAVPVIRHFDCVYSKGLRHAVRLFNMPGVVTHAVVLGVDITEIELTAYIAEGVVPEVSLRINGNQGNLPKFVLEGEKTSGMRWTVSVRSDIKIEVVATKPGALAESSVIFLHRQ